MFLCKIWWPWLLWWRHSWKTLQVSPHCFCRTNSNIVLGIEIWATWVKWVWTPWRSQCKNPITCFYLNMQDIWGGAHIKAGVHRRLPRLSDLGHISLLGAVITWPWDIPWSSHMVSLSQDMRNALVTGCPMLLWAGAARHSNGHRAQCHVVKIMFLGSDNSLTQPVTSCHQGALSPRALSPRPCSRDQVTVSLTFLRAHKPDFAL